MDQTPQSSWARRFAPLAALQHRDFLLLWLGQFISTLGTQMRIVAVNVQIYQIARDTGTLDPALALGLIGLARVIPIVAMALFSGLVADRVDRRWLLIVTSLASLLGSAALALISQSETPSLWLIYLIVAAVAVAGAFEMPARQAIIPTLVPTAQLPNALSLNIITWQLATVIGPSLAGVLIAWSGVSPVYWIDAVTFLAVVVAALLMRPRGAPARMPEVSVGAALEGMRFVIRTPLIASTMLLDFFATFFGAAMTLLPLFADQVLRVGETELGLLYAAPSAGALVAAAVLTTLRIRRQGAVLLWAVAIFGVCTAVFGLSTSFPLTLLALAGSGAADTVSMVIRGTIRQLMTPDELRGRTTAVNMIFFAGGPQLGELESGILASIIGAPLAVTLGGIMCVALVGLTAWQGRTLRRYTSDA
ncbi:MAG TPA: MFS transporter [Roseiflexaceae bacterium]|nr:MFS transporter [Roseiflexaceae bacterium]